MQIGSEVPLHCGPKVWCSIDVGMEQILLSICELLKTWVLWEVSKLFLLCFLAEFCSALNPVVGILESYLVLSLISLLFCSWSYSKRAAALDIATNNEHRILLPHIVSSMQGLAIPWNVSVFSAWFTKRKQLFKPICNWEKHKQTAIACCICDTVKKALPSKPPPQ